jgi:hypothetical protein
MEFVNWPPAATVDVFEMGGAALVIAYAREDVYGHDEM